MKLSRQEIQLTSFLLFSLDTHENANGSDYSVWCYRKYGDADFEYLSHNSGNFTCDDYIIENFTRYQWNKIKRLFK